MKRSELFVGLRIKATSSTTHDFGTIVDINGQTITINWDTDSHFWKTVCSNDSTVAYWQPLKEAPVLSKEQLIEARIKRLWNNSKYVQNNPSQAY